ncbi:DNA polymerase zeta catalytic subunit [Novymonas esmeraldas]|uniref:DNA-directed DNA polymerase n=1 Tax=Novymonas esmeraldas TaxID=1808958 RepID=A0AAW0ERN7_9TRYP
MYMQVVSVEHSLERPRAELGDAVLSPVLHRVSVRCPVLHLFGYVHIPLDAGPGTAPGHHHCPSEVDDTRAGAAPAAPHPDVGSSGNALPRPSALTAAATFSGASPSPRPVSHEVKECVGAAAAARAHGEDSGRLLSGAGDARRSRTGWGGRYTQRRACLHVHGVYPSLLLPQYDRDVSAAQLAAQLETVVLRVLARQSIAVPGQQLVHNVRVVHRLSVYGYRPHAYAFYMVELIDPAMLPRVVDVLQSSTEVGGRRWQLYDAHSRYHTQFMVRWRVNGVAPFLVPTALCHVRLPTVPELSGDAPAVAASLVEGRRTCAPEPGASASSALFFCRRWRADELGRGTTAEVELDIAAADLHEHAEADAATAAPQPNTLATTALPRRGGGAATGDNLSYTRRAIRQYFSEHGVPDALRVADTIAVEAHQHEREHHWSTGGDAAAPAPRPGQQQQQQRRYGTVVQVQRSDPTVRWLRHRMLSYLADRVHVAKCRAASPPGEEVSDTARRLVTAPHDASTAFVGTSAELQEQRAFRDRLVAAHRQRGGTVGAVASTPRSGHGHRRGAARTDADGQPCVLPSLTHVPDAQTAAAAAAGGEAVYIGFSSASLQLCESQGHAQQSGYGAAPRTTPTADGGGDAPVAHADVAAVPTQDLMAALVTPERLPSTSAHCTPASPAVAGRVAAPVLPALPSSARESEAGADASTAEEVCQLQCAVDADHECDDVAEAAAARQSDLWSSWSSWSFASESADSHASTATDLEPHATPPPPPPAPRLRDTADDAGGDCATQPLPTPSPRTDSPRSAEPRASCTSGASATALHRAAPLAGVVVGRCLAFVRVRLANGSARRVGEVVAVARVAGVTAETVELQWLLRLCETHLAAEEPALVRRGSWLRSHAVPTTSGESPHHWRRHRAGGAAAAVDLGEVVLSDARDVVPVALLQPDGAPTALAYAAAVSAPTQRLAGGGGERLDAHTAEDTCTSPTPRSRLSGEAPTMQVWSVVCATSVAAYSSGAVSCSHDTAAPLLRVLCRYAYKIAARVLTVVPAHIFITAASSPTADGGSPSPARRTARRISWRSPDGAEGMLESPRWRPSERSCVVVTQPQPLPPAVAASPSSGASAPTALSSRAARLEAVEDDGDDMPLFPSDSTSSSRSRSDAGEDVRQRLHDVAVVTSAADRPSLPPRLSSSQGAEEDDDERHGGTSPRCCWYVTLAPLPLPSSFTVGGVCVTRSVPAAAPSASCHDTPRRGRGDLPRGAEQRTSDDGASTAPEVRFSHVSVANGSDGTLASLQSGEAEQSGCVEVAVCSSRLSSLQSSQSSLEPVRVVRASQRSFVSLFQPAMDSVSLLQSCGRLGSVVDGMPRPATITAAARGGPCDAPGRCRRRDEDARVRVSAVAWPWGSAPAGGGVAAPHLYDPVCGDAPTSARGAAAAAGPSACRQARPLQPASLGTPRRRSASHVPGLTLSATQQPQHYLQCTLRVLYVEVLLNRPAGEQRAAASDVLAVGLGQATTAADSAVAVRLFCVAAAPPLAGVTASVQVVALEDEAALLARVRAEIIAYDPDILLSWEGIKYGLGYLALRYRVVLQRDLAADLSRLLHHHGRGRGQPSAAPPAPRGDVADADGASRPAPAAAADVAAAPVLSPAPSSSSSRVSLASSTASLDVSAAAADVDGGGRAMGWTRTGARWDGRSAPPRGTDRGGAAAPAGAASGAAAGAAYARRFGATVRVVGRLCMSLGKDLRKDVKLTGYSLPMAHLELLGQPLPYFTDSYLAELFLAPQRAGTDGGGAGERHTALRYLAARVAAPHRIACRLRWFTRLLEFSRMYGILAEEVVTRGSQFRVEATLLRLAQPLGYAMLSPSRAQVHRQPRIECIPLVMQPRSDLYRDDPVVVLDFRSLYPSIIIAYNLCYSTCLGMVQPQAHGRLGVLSHFKQSDAVLAELLPDDGAQHESAIFSPNGAVFVPRHTRVGLLPQMVQAVLDTRFQVQAALQHIATPGEDAVMAQRLQEQQLALKMLANVTYGYTAASYSGRMPCVDLAEAIVSLGRQTLERAVALLHSTPAWGAEVVYGDTDSIFVRLAGRTKAEAFRIGQEMADAVTRSNPPPVRMQFEKVLLPCLLLVKKRYAGYMWTSPMQTTPTFLAKGIEVVRRDQCAATAQLAQQLLRLLFDGASAAVLRRAYATAVARLQAGSANPLLCVLRRAVRLGRYGESSSAHLPPAARLAMKQMEADALQTPYWGERLPYVVVRSIASAARLSDQVLHPARLLEVDDVHSLDATYYITRHVNSALDRMFYLVGISFAQVFQSLPRRRTAHASLLHQSTFMAVQAQQQLQQHQPHGAASPLASSTAADLVRSPRRRLERVGHLASLMLELLHDRQPLSAAVPTRRGAPAVVEEVESRGRDVAECHRVGQPRRPVDVMDLTRPTVREVVDVEQPATQHSRRHSRRHSPPPSVAERCRRRAGRASPSPSGQPRQRRPATLDTFYPRTLCIVCEAAAVSLDDVRRQRTALLRSGLCGDGDDSPAHRLLLPPICTRCWSDPASLLLHVQQRCRSLGGQSEALQRLCARCISSGGDAGDAAADEYRRAVADMEDMENFCASPLLQRPMGTPHDVQMHGVDGCVPRHVLGAVTVSASGVQRGCVSVDCAVSFQKRMVTVQQAQWLRVQALLHSVL